MVSDFYVNPCAGRRHRRRIAMVLKPAYLLDLGEQGAVVRVDAPGRLPAADREAEQQPGPSTPAAGAVTALAGFAAVAWAAEEQEGAQDEEGA